MIVVENPSFAYPVGDVSLTIPSLILQPCEKVTVVGPSGAGKTTLLNLIAGIAMPASGAMRPGVDVISGMSDAARQALRASRIGFVFQDSALLDHPSAGENILLPERIAAGAKFDAEARASAYRLAASCGLQGTLACRPDALSQGEQHASRCAGCW